MDSDRLDKATLLRARIKTMRGLHAEWERVNPSNYDDMAVRLSPETMLQMRRLAMSDLEQQIDAAERDFGNA
jgi:hypothetical protein